MGWLGAAQQDLGFDKLSRVSTTYSATQGLIAS